MESCPGLWITSGLVGLQRARSAGLRNAIGSAGIIFIFLLAEKAKSLDLVTEQNSLRTRLGDPRCDPWKSSCKWTHKMERGIIDVINGKTTLPFLFPTFLNGSGHWSLHDVERRDSCLFWVWLFQCNACQDAIKPYESEGLGFRCLLRIPA